MERKDVIQLIIDKLSARKYLEIGVFDGRCFMEIRAPYKTAVDPDMKITFRYKLHAIRKRPENLRNKYKHTTSDIFFNEIIRSNKKTVFDVVFIDGLHTYQQTFFDIIHTLQHIHLHSALVLHDINPETEALALPAASRSAARSVHKEKSFWCGDSWKSFHHFIQLNKRLDQFDLFTLNCDYGLGIAFPKPNFNPSDWMNLKPEKFYEELPYSFLEQKRKEVISLVDPEYLHHYLNNKTLRAT